MDILKNLDKFIKKQHLKKCEFAKKISLSNSYVSEILSGKRNISIKFKKGFQSEYGFPIEELPQRVEIPPEINPDGENQDNAIYCKLPLFNIKASAGHEKFVNNDKIGADLMFRKDWLRRELRSTPDNLFILSAESDSMEPTIKHDSLLIVDKSITRIITEGIYILRRGDTILIKRIRKLSEDTIELISDNPAYGKETIQPNRQPEITILGKVIYIWSGRKI
ncbi:peptidase S24-like domain protein [Candidatus Scalindua japonica]|uniref:Peptidase S24-like domain protein n=1 Tax=Candidatus Scalindua japonica TaxID=1284222 RepID=A0A286U3Z1_9BACT|nr:LexA family transcriptional regulator [Candidatus Scalindua japonica]GAX62845.1 peptidase S24-like domain protein [Candidatus Scalindua japonica]